MVQLVRANPGLLVWIALFAIALLVCSIIGSLMKRSGVSRRPIYWFAGLILLIGGPQFLAHLFIAARAVKMEAPRREALATLASSAPAETRREAARRLFGPDVDLDLVVDARAFFGDALAQADDARLATFGSGESVLLARFRGFSDAERAWVRYLQHTGLNAAGGKGDSARGYSVTRPGGDRAYVAHFDNLLGVWTGPDDATIRRRLWAGDFKIPRRAPLADAPETAAAPTRAAVGGSPTDTRLSWSHPVRVLAVGTALAAYLLVVVAYFFKGARWVGSAAAAPGVKPVSAGELAIQLERLNQLDVPFRVERGRRPNEFFVTWRYADAKWIDLARVRGLRRTFRIGLTLDESARVARATDYVASYDWSVGAGGADFEWKAMAGISFFQREHQRDWGIPLGADGPANPSASVSLRFDLQELKAPLISTVTGLGWTWRPVLWQGPWWLKWLTE